MELSIENSISASEGVRHILVYTKDVDATIAPLEAWSSLPAQNIAVYGQLGGVQ